METDRRVTLLMTMDSMSSFAAIAICIGVSLPRNSINIFLLFLIFVGQPHGNVFARIWRGGLKSVATLIGQSMSAIRTSGMLG